MIHSVYTKAQGVASMVVMQNEQKPNWEPFKLGVDGNNVQNNVAFFTQKSDCNSKQVVLVKVVNSNTYPVNLSYQISAETPVVEVKIPASITLEGTCSSTDANLVKLVVDFPKGKTEDEIKKIEEYTKMHLVVSKSK